MLVSFLLDVEDIVTPEADDITRDVARLLTDEGIQATFCIVGERVRQWTARGRHDVIEALAAHDIGSHTDYHSVHPTIIEYIGESDWASGVAAASSREEPAIRALREAFGVPPSCWGGPGNTWAPQINEAVAALGCPSIVYAHTMVPRGDVHRFCGALCYPVGHHVGDGQYHDNDQSAANVERVRAALTSDAASGCAWREVFLGHPSRILHEEFWDGPNYIHGRNPPTDACILPRRKSQADLATALGNLRRAAVAVRDTPGIEIATIRDVNARAIESPTEPLTAAEIAEVTPLIDANLRSMADWVILPPDTDTSAIRKHTLERLTTLERVKLAA